MKSTPGPWHVKFERLGEGQFPYHWIESTNVFSCVCNLPSGNTHPENEANARLIAVAPDYHEEAYVLALLVLQSDLYKDPDVRDQVNNVLAIHRRVEEVNP